MVARNKKIAEEIYRILHVNPETIRDILDILPIVAFNILDNGDTFCLDGFLSIKPVIKRNKSIDLKTHEYTVYPPRMHPRLRLNKELLKDLNERDYEWEEK